MRLISIIGIMAAATQMAAAQQDTLRNVIDRDVEVVNNYLPIISNPHKLQVAPVIDDTMSYKATFNYSIIEKVQSVKTTPDSLKVANMTFSPEQTQYSAFVRGGVGNYGNILGEFLYNIGTNKNYRLGLDIGHHSMLGKVKLEENNEKVKAASTNTWVNTDFSRLYKKVALDANVKFKNYTYKHYGYESFVDTADYYGANGEVVKGEILRHSSTSQRQTSFDVAVGFGNRLRDPRDKVSFGAKAAFGAFGNVTGLSEIDIHFDGFARFPIRKNYLFDINFDFNKSRMLTPDDYEGIFYSSSPSRLSARNHTDITITPHFGIDFDHVALRAGLNFILDFGGKEDNFYYQPDIYADFNVSDGAASLYLGMTGGFRANTFRELAAMNPWVSTDSYDRAWIQEDGAYGEMHTTQNPIKMVVGVRAKMSHAVAFDIAAEYCSFDDEVFFINKAFSKVDTTVLGSSYSNMFEVINENGKVKSVKGELSITPTSRTMILVKGAYHKWQVNYLEEAWYKPKYEVGVDLRLKPFERLLVTAGVNSIGKRYAFNPETQKKQELDMLLNVDLGAEYRLTSQLSVFLRCNNIAAQNYQHYLGYSSYRFNALAGVTFKF